MTLTGLDFNPGTLTIAAGTLAVGQGGQLVNHPAVQLAASGVIFDISTGSNQRVGDLSGVAGSTVVLGANSLTAGLTNSTTLASVIAGTGGFTYQGQGMLTLTGINTYTGATTINAGTLALGSAARWRRAAASTSAVPGSSSTFRAAATRRSGTCPAQAARQSRRGQHAEFRHRQFDEFRRWLHRLGRLVKQGGGDLQPDR